MPTNSDLFVGKAFQLNPTTKYSFFLLLLPHHHIILYLYIRFYSPVRSTHFLTNSLTHSLTHSLTLKFSNIKDTKQSRLVLSLLQMRLLLQLLPDLQKTLLFGFSHACLLSRHRHSYKSFSIRHLCYRHMQLPVMS